MQVGPLAATRRVLLPEQRGHGHTPDPGDLSYALMAGDTAELLDRVGGGPFDLVGWSDGGIVAMHVALARPDLVRKVVTIGSNFHAEGTLPEFFEGSEDMSMLEPAYSAVSPDGPAHFPVVLAKLRDVWRTQPTLTVDDIARIEAPFLVLVADDDAVAFEHTLALYRALPNGQLAVVPGTSHLVPIEKPDLVNRLILDFLDDGAVVGILPMRRAVSDAPT
jgi:pimeloyl-ACP methyl ester carboxylesterase